MSNVNANEIDPTCTADDTDRARLPLAPVATLHITNVSEAHSVKAPPVEPERTSPLAPLVPNPAPLKLKKPPPVEPMLRMAAPDADTESYDTLLEIDPSIPPADIITIKLPSSPERALQTTLVSDTQPVASAPLDPARLPTLYRRVPKLDPLTVMLLPVAGFAFPIKKPDNKEISKERAALIDPEADPRETTKNRLPSDPETDLHVIDVSDTHSVPPAPVRPSRLRALYRLAPKSAPLTLTLPPPVLP
jgi:hypothetical protein